MNPVNALRYHWNVNVLGPAGLRLQRWPAEPRPRRAGPRPPRAPAGR